MFTVDDNDLCTCESRARLFVNVHIIFCQEPIKFDGLLILRDECFVYFTYCYCTNQNRIKNLTMNAKT